MRAALVTSARQPQGPTPTQRRGQTSHRHHRRRHRPCRSLRSPPPPPRLRRRPWIFRHLSWRRCPLESGWRLEYVVAGGLSVPGQAAGRSLTFEELYQEVGLTVPALTAPPPPSSGSAPPTSDSKSVAIAMLVGKPPSPSPSSQASSSGLSLARSPSVAWRARAARAGAGFTSLLISFTWASLLLTLPCSRGRGQSGGA